jgi:hypothetical protein
MYPKKETKGYNEIKNKDCIMMRERYSKFLKEYDNYKGGDKEEMKKYYEYYLLKYCK